MPILFDYTFFRQRKTFHQKLYICFLVEIEEVAWVESLYGVHVKFTVFVFILAAFVEFWGCNVDVTFSCILVLTERSSVSC